MSHLLPRFVVQSSEPAFDTPKGSIATLQSMASSVLRLLRSRNWSLPGIEVHFLTAHTDDGPVRYVRFIKANGITLSFNYAGLCTVQHGKRDLWVTKQMFNLHLYSGSDRDWVYDRDNFRAGLLGSKHPDRVLVFHSRCFCQDFEDAPSTSADHDKNEGHHHDDAVDTTFVCDGQDNRDVERELQLAVRAIKQKLIEPLTALAKPVKVRNLFPKRLRTVEGVRFSVLLERHTIRQLHFEREEGGSPALIDELRTRHSALRDGTYRQLVSIYDALVGSSLSITRATSIKHPDLVHLHGMRSDQALVRVTPKYSNDIYIMERLTFEAIRTNKVKGDELTEIFATTVPLSKYLADNISYPNPVYLVLRALEPDEVEIVGGTWDELEEAREVCRIIRPHDAMLIQELSKQWDGGPFGLNLLEQDCLERLSRRLGRNWKLARHTRRASYLGNRRSRARACVTSSVRALNTAREMGTL